MTYYITAINDAGFIASETRTTDAALRDLIVADLERRGFLVSVRESRGFSFPSVKTIERGGHVPRS